MLKPARCFKNDLELRKNSHKRQPIVWLHFYDMSRIGKSIAAGKLAAAHMRGGWEQREAEGLLANAGDTNVLKLDCSDSK